MRVRHTDEWVGALVIAAIVVLLVAVLQAGVLRDWFRPTSQLRLILPATGVAGLETGADVEILGTKAGTVQQIVLNPDQQMYALIELDEQAKAFIRRDSAAVIRRRFGVAGAAFVDISRGTGEKMDWSYAVISATTERAPTDSVSALIDEVRQKIFPVLDNAGRATQALAEIVERVNRGEGNLGRILVDQTLIQQTETTVTSARDAMKSLNLLVAQLIQTAGSLRDVTQKVGGSQGVPAVL
jgi:phospholipid/cholesterol/gamma-HCH transport system substrate-binding protein